MAFCPECNATMGQTDIVCPDCGYDFPEKLAEIRAGLTRSPLAHISLNVAAGLAFLAAVATAVWAAFALLYTVVERRPDHLLELILSPFCFLFWYALFVVFVRVQKH
mgnify:CR=1|jgi:hypothetical protein